MNDNISAIGGFQVEALPRSASFGVLSFIETNFRATIKDGDLTIAIRILLSKQTCLYGVYVDIEGEVC